MPASLLIAGIGNIFQGDDAFGVAVVHKLAELGVPEHVKLLDVGIRSIDLGFTLLDRYELTVLVDATTRGEAPGTLYTIEIRPGDIPDACDEAVVVNSHSLDPVRGLGLAKSMGAEFKRVLLIACEPLVVDHDETGLIGLSEIVEAAVDLAVDNIRQLIQEFIVTTEQEVYSHEHV